MRTRSRAFTLVELLVVIGIIALLIGILLPALAKAREQSRQIKCAANLRSVGQGILIYMNQYRQFFPASYTYVGQQFSGGSQTPNTPINGYVHWTSFLYSDGGVGSTPTESFTCPSIENGGLPPTNTTPQNHDGQPNDAGVSIIDLQAPRCAFTLNEALCPRNKWVLGFQGAVRVYQYVNAAQLGDASHIILGTEFPQVAKLVEDVGEVSGALVCKSHRPVHGFKGLTGGLDMSLVPPDPYGTRPTYTRVSASDLQPDPQPGATSASRLDWVGRNHGTKKLQQGFNPGSSNFLYADGHVETKSVVDTLGIPGGGSGNNAFEWGDYFYSLRPNNDITY